MPIKTLISAMQRWSERMFATGADVEAATTVVEDGAPKLLVSAEGANGGAMLPSDLAFTVGSRYSVNIDDTEYVCVCVEMSGEGETSQIIGNIGGYGELIGQPNIGPNTGEPFIVLASSAMPSPMLVLLVEGVHSFSISEQGEPTVRRLADAFSEIDGLKQSSGSILESVDAVAARVDEVAAHIDEVDGSAVKRGDLFSKSYEWDGNPYNLEKLTYGSTTYYKVSDEVVPFEFVKSAKSVMSDGDVDDRHWTGNGCYKAGASIVVTAAGSCSLPAGLGTSWTSFTAPSTGVYFRSVYVSGQGNTYTETLDIETSVFIELVELEANAATKEYVDQAVAAVPAPSTLSDSYSGSNINMRGQSTWRATASSVKNIVFMVNSDGSSSENYISLRAKDNSTLMIRADGMVYPSNSVLKVGMSAYLPTTVKFVKDPTEDTDAANKKYVDDSIAALEARLAALESK